LDLLEVGNFIETLSDRTTLKELAFYEPQIQSLVHLCLTDYSNPETSFNVLNLFYIFAQFQSNISMDCQLQLDDQEFNE